MIALVLLAALHSYFLFESVVIRPAEGSVIGVERWSRWYRRLLGIPFYHRSWLGECIVGSILWSINIAFYSPTLGFVLSTGVILVVTGFTLYLVRMQLIREDSEISV